MYYGASSALANCDSDIDGVIMRKGRVQEGNLSAPALFERARKRQVQASVRVGSIDVDSERSLCCDHGDTEVICVQNALMVDSVESSGAVDSRRNAEAYTPVSRSFLYGAVPVLLAEVGLDVKPPDLLSTFARHSPCLDVPMMQEAAQGALAYEKGPDVPVSAVVEVRASSLGSGTRGRAVWKDRSAGALRAQARDRGLTSRSLDSYEARPRTASHVHAGGDIVVVRADVLAGFTHTGPSSLSTHNSGGAFVVQARAVWATATTQQRPPAVPGTRPHRPSSCVHCGFLLKFLSTELLTTCGRCMMPAHGAPRVVGRAPLLAIQGLRSEGNSSASTRDECLASMPLRVLAVVDFFWSGVRVCPIDSNMVVVLRGSEVVARMPAQQARLMRASLLTSWARVMPAMEVNEIDVAAYIVAWCLSVPVAMWPQCSEAAGARFLGDSHTFAPFSLRWEPGRYRRAVMATVLDPIVGDPCTSAYHSVLGFHSPLRAEGFAHLLPSHHPHAAYLWNCVMFGFPILAPTPSVSRWAPQPQPGGVDGVAFLEAVRAEVDAGYMMDITDEAYAWCLRFCPLLPVPKSDGRIRLVSDLTWGDGAVNDYTRRGRLPKARLIRFQSLFDRILYMRAARPGVKVVLTRIDLECAFKQCSVPVQDFHKVAHRLGANVYVMTSSAMGSASSADQMGGAYACLADVLAAQGTFAGCYLDDAIIVCYEDEANSRVSAACALLKEFGWVISWSKFSAPSTQMVVLGVLVDTVAGTATIVESRRIKVLELLRSWLDGSVRMTRQAFKKLAGTLEFLAQSCVPFGKVFLRSFYACAYGDDDIVTSLDVGTLRADLMWWHECLLLGGVSITVAFVERHISSSVRVTSDASGRGWGCVNEDARQYVGGLFTAELIALSSVGHWEAMAVVLAAAQWGSVASGSFLYLQTDSESCYHVFTRERCDDERTYIFLRLLSFIQMHFRFRLVVTWIPGVTNVLSDAVSRQMSLLGLHPDAASFVRSLADPSLVQCLHDVLLTSRAEASTAAPQLVARACATLPGTVMKSDSIGNSAYMPVMPWRSPVRVGKQLGGCSTLRYGYQRTGRAWSVTPLRSMSAQCGSTSTSLLATCQRILGCSQSIFCVCNRCHGSGPSASQHRSRWSGPLWTTSQFRLESASLFCVRIRRFCEAASCVRLKLTLRQLRSLCAHIMYAGTIQWVVSRFTLPAAKATGTTSAVKRTSLPTQATVTVQQQRFSGTCDVSLGRRSSEAAVDTVVREIVTGRSLSNAMNMVRRRALRSTTSLKPSRRTVALLGCQWTESAVTHSA